MDQKAGRMSGREAYSMVPFEDSDPALRSTQQNGRGKMGRALMCP
jgi:hypothetical protein